MKTSSLCPNFDLGSFSPVMILWAGMKKTLISKSSARRKQIEHESSTRKIVFRLNDFSDPAECFALNEAILSLYPGLACKPEIFMSLARFRVAGSISRRLHLTHWVALSYLLGIHTQPVLLAVTEFKGEISNPLIKQKKTKINFEISRTSSSFVAVKLKLVELSWGADSYMTNHLVEVRKR